MEAGCGEHCISVQAETTFRTVVTGCSEGQLGPLAGINDKNVCWTAPDPSASHKAPGNKTHILSHTHTEHRPHAAPKGQKKTLIRAGELIRIRDSEHGSRGTWAGRTHLCSSSTRTVPRWANLGPLSWKGVRWPPGQFFYLGAISPALSLLCVHVSSLGHRPHSCHFW